MLALFTSLLAVPGLAFAQNVLNPGVSNAGPPSNASQPLDTRLISFSIEPAYLDQFLGDAATPNTLVLNLFSEIANRTGGIAVRPGGITADSTIYDPSLTEVETLDLSPAGGVYRTTYGPAFFEVLKRLPASTQFVACLNLGNDSLEIASTQAQAAVEALGSQLYALEFGNEPDQYTSAQRNLSDWYAPQYSAQFDTWAANISSALSLPEPFFQAGAMAMDPTPSARFTTADLVAAGIDNTTPRRIKTFSNHQYQYSTCDPERDALIQNVTTLINHTSITTYVDLWKPQVAAAQSVGAELVIGEFSSISCSGKENVSDTFGQALWLVDTYLYAASNNITRLYSHQGATLALQSSTQSNTAGFSWYNFVYPQDSSRNGPRGATASYVGFLLIAEALGPNAAQNATRLAYYPLADQPELAFYAIWDATSRPSAEGPARLVLLNTGAADSLAVDLASLRPSSLKRLTSTSVQSRNASEATWAGQSYSTGVPAGQEIVESVGTNGSVRLGAYEAVLVFLGNATSTASEGTTVTSSSAGSSSPSTGAGGSSGGSTGGSDGIRVLASSGIPSLALGALVLVTLL